MIIWGFGRRTVRRHGSTIYQRCNVCHNSGWWQLVTVRRSFTLFFVPIVPYSRRDLLLCPVCNRGAELNKAGRQQALQLTAATRALNNHEIDKAAYQQRIAEITGSGAVPGIAPAMPSSADAAASAPTDAASAGEAGADVATSPDAHPPQEGGTGTSE